MLRIEFSISPSVVKAISLPLGDHETSPRESQWRDSWKMVDRVRGRQVDDRDGPLVDEHQLRAVRRPVQPRGGLRWPPPTGLAARLRSPRRAPRCSASACRRSWSRRRSIELRWIATVRATWRVDPRRDPAAVLHARSHLPDRPDLVALDVATGEHDVAVLDLGGGGGGPGPVATVWSDMVAAAHADDRCDPVEMHGLPPSWLRDCEAARGSSHTRGRRSRGRPAHTAFWLRRRLISDCPGAAEVKVESPRAMSSQILRRVPTSVIRFLAHRRGPLADVRVLAVDRDLAREVFGTTRSSL